MTWPRGSHGNTFGGNPLACAAALATIDLLEKEYIQNASERGAYILSRLREMAIRHPSIGDVRGFGLMIGVEFIKNAVTKEPAEKLRDHIVEQSFLRGLLLLGCGKSTIRFTPPLNVSLAEIDEAFQIFEEAITVSEIEVQPIVA